MEYKKPIAHLVHTTPLSLGEVAGRSCYNSFELATEQSIKDFKQNYTVEDIDSSELLNKLTWAYQHESINEHITLSYYLEQVSREVVIEMNRHRIGIATSQRSTRYTIESLVDVWIDAINKPELYPCFVEVVRKNIIDADEDMISITARYIHNKLYYYYKEEPLIKGLTGSKKKKQNDRVKRCLPEVWMMEGLWTFNLRSLKHFLDLRNSGAAYYGIREVADAIIAATPKKYLDLVIKGK